MAQSRIAKFRRLSLRQWMIAAALPALLTGLFAQRPFREYPPMEGGDSVAALPPDYQSPAELVLGRLMYPSGGGRGRGGGGNWVNGGSNWTVDYPRGDRTFAVAIRRLSRIDVRSVEQPVNPDDGDDIYYWPYLHVGMPTSWNLTDAQAAKIREYLLRGGFMLCDSFFGTQEWAGFEAGMKRIFPDRQIEDLPEQDPIFHTAYDVTERYQVGNFRSMQRNGNTYRADGDKPYWRGIRDDKGRVVVAITFNNDLGDSWQLADNPQYPQKFSYLGIRLGLNFVVYTMTH
ncbi:MAG: DUF4159 domain-containing protein [Candidatus Solibacter sp.]